LYSNGFEPVYPVKGISVPSRMMGAVLVRPNRIWTDNSESSTRNTIVPMTHLWLWMVRHSLIETILLSQPHSLYVTTQWVAYFYSKGLLRKLSSYNGSRTRYIALQYLSDSQHTSRYALHILWFRRDSNPQSYIVTGWCHAPCMLLDLILKLPCKGITNIFTV
jgi:hypothetical protein